MSESIKKVEHADFVGLLAKNTVDDKIVHAKIGKNRAGQSNINLDFQVDFSQFKFIDVMRCSNKNKQDASSTSSNPMKFGGFGEGVNEY